MMSFQTDLNRTKRLVSLAILCASGTLHTVAAEQPAATLRPRQSGGWIPVNKESEQPIQSPVKTAYFQAQGSLSDTLPVFPASDQAVPPFPGARGLPGTVSPPVVPPEMIAPPQLPMARNNQQPITPDRIANEQQNVGNTPNFNDQQVYGNQPSHQPSDQPTNYQRQPNSSVPSRTPAGELRTIQNDRLPASGNTAPAMGSNGTNQSAASSNRRTQGNDTRLAAEGFTSGLPFVTPAPRGRYATSPYQPAVFQLPEYRAVPVPAQFASSSSAVPQAYVAPQPVAVANLSATQALTPQPVENAAPNYLTAQQATLPQFRYPQPAIVQTAYQQCNTMGPSVPSTGAVPGTFTPPTLPPNLTPNLYTPNNSGFTPFFSLGQENYNVQLGRGIIGQPTVYVPGQPIRNFMRYMSP